MCLQHALSGYFQTNFGNFQSHFRAESFWDIDQRANSHRKTNGSLHLKKFQTVQSSPHTRALHIPGQIWAGKLKLEFLPAIGLTKAFPVAQIRPNLHKIVSSCIRAFPVAQICPNSHKIVSSCLRGFPVAPIRSNSHKIVFSCIRAFLVAQICQNSHRIVYSRVRAFIVA